VVGDHRVDPVTGPFHAEDMQAAILKVPAGSWTPAYDGGRQARDGAWGADITGMLDLSSWPGRCGSSSAGSGRLDRAVT
jgi:hypothetical protein